MQERIGSDKLEVLLLSVDRSYGSMARFDPDKKAKQIFAKSKVVWPNVRLPNGWDDAQRQFNAGGYGLILVDAKGIVVGTHVQPKQIKRLLNGGATADDAKD